MAEPRSEPHPGQGVYFVNDRKGRVNAPHEDFTGKEILERVGLSSDRYELFTIEHDKVAAEIKPDQVHRVKPGDHFRAILRNIDYSFRMEI